MFMVHVPRMSFLLHFANSLLTFSKTYLEQCLHQEEAYVNSSLPSWIQAVSPHYITFHLETKEAVNPDSVFFYTLTFFKIPIN